MFMSFHRAQSDHWNNTVYITWPLPTDTCLKQNQNMQLLNVVLGYDGPLIKLTGAEQTQQYLLWPTAEE